jgi:hypothetical protein
MFRHSPHYPNHTGNTAFRKAGLCWSGTPSEIPQPNKPKPAAAPPDSGLHCQESHQDPIGTAGQGGKRLSFLAKYRR